MRKGTHDFYNERGLALTTWNGEHFIGQGDAFMKPADATRAANAVRDSLDATRIDSFAGKVELTSPDDPKYAEADSFDVCKEPQFPTEAGKRKDIAIVVPILRQTPVPGLGKGPGELPRFPHRDGDVCRLIDRIPRWIVDPRVWPWRGRGRCYLRHPSWRPAWA